MFPCSSIYQHFPRANQAMIKIDDTTIQNVDNRDDHQNPISSNHDQYYYYYSSPYNSQDAIEPPMIFEDDGVILSHLLSQHQLLACNNIISSYNNSQFPQAGNNDEITVAGGDRDKPSKGPSSKRQTVPRKKDRHSKICTAQGLRDRRMRLSLPIARKFFDLQDMLGFDKASRTIDWLFAKSKTAIKELKDSLLPKHNSASSEAERGRESIKPSSSKEPMAAAKRKIMGRKREKLVVARESRDKARARARERTRERMIERSRRDQSTRLNSPKVEEDLEHRPDLELDHHHYSSLSIQQGRYFGGTNSEEDFLGFPDQNWDMIQNPPYESGDFYSTLEQKPSSNNIELVSTSSDNPNLVFVTRTASNSQNHTLINLPVQNPNPTFMASSNISEHQEESSNIFCSLGF